jgi:hypothetical protein
MFFKRLTNALRQSPSAANSFAYGDEILRFVWQLIFQYRVHQNQLLGLDQNQLNLIDSLARFILFISVH